MGHRKDLGDTEKLWHDDVGGESYRVLVVRWELGWRCVKVWGIVERKAESLYIYKEVIPEVLI